MVLKELKVFKVFLELEEIPDQLGLLDMMVVEVYRGPKVFKVSKGHKEFKV